MKYITLNKILKFAILGLIIGVFFSCNNKETTLDIPTPVLANYSFELEDSVVTFTNKSVGATEYLWEFGDGTTSTEEHSVHTFEAGDYIVKLTAKGAAGENEFSDNLKITAISDTPDEGEEVDELVAETIRLLSGGTAKSWVIAKESDAYAFGPLDDENVNWFVVDQYDADVFNTRTCLFNSEFTFNTEGVYTRNMNGSIWKEWQFFESEECSDVSTTLVTKNGDNVDVWKDGEFTYEVKNDNGVAVLEIYGLGGYLGHFTSGVNSSDFLPKEYHKYEIKSISDNQIKISSYGYNGDSPVNPTAADRLIRMTLVPSGTVVEEPEEENVSLANVQALLNGGTTKSWVIAKEDNAYNFGPKDSESGIWWGIGPDEIEGRPCIFDTEFTFGSDGSYTRNMNGTVWKDWRIFDDVTCVDATEDLVTKNGDEVNVWKDGSFTYTLTEDNGEIFINTEGLGGYVGLYTSGIDAADYLPHQAHTYRILSIEDGRLELFSYGYGGDSEDAETYDPNSADRSIRLTLVPVQ